MSFYFCHIPCSSFDILVIDYGDRAHHVIFNAYIYTVREGYPPFWRLEGATIKHVEDKEGFQILEDCKTKNGYMYKLEELIQQLKDLPF